MRADLHIHTWFSDGVESPQRVVELAARAGLDLIAITDHDSMGAYEQAVAAGRDAGVRVLAAAEFTTVSFGMDVHILGYFPLKPDGVVRDHLQRMQDYRRRRMENAVRQLRIEGYTIGFDDLPVSDHCESLTSAHLARLLLTGGFARSFRSIWRRRAVRDALGGFEVHPDEAIKVIHAGGGLAVWAHPAQKRFTRRLDELTALGLDGVEAYNARRDGSRAGEMAAEAASRGLVTTGGSDWHEGLGLGDSVFEGAPLAAFLQRLGDWD